MGSTRIQMLLYKLDNTLKHIKLLKKVIVKAEDAKLYECNINEGDKVCLDINNKLEKVE